MANKLDSPVLGGDFLRMFKVVKEPGVIMCYETSCTLVICFSQLCWGLCLVGRGQGKERVQTCEGIIEGNKGS